MKIIILGVGRVGETLVKNFILENNQVTVIDENPERVQAIVNKYDVFGITAGGLERDVLIDLNVSNVDFFIACTSHDEMNLLSCALAKKLGAKKTIARVRDPQYFREVGKIRDELGIDLAFNPELRAASDIARILRFPYADDVETFAGGRVVMVSLIVNDSNPIVNKNLREISSTYKQKVLFSLVKRKEEYFIPNGDFTILAGDVIYLLAEEEDIANFLKKLKVYKQKSKSVFIVGGGKVAFYLAKELANHKVDVKIVEKDKERCLELANDIPSATIINGDGTDDELLIEEGITNYAAFVALTGVDEENTIVSLFANSKGVKKIITKLERDSVIKMTKKLGVNTVISPREAISNHIIRFIRSNSFKEDASLNTLYKLGQNVEVLEFVAKEDFKGLNVPLKQLKIKSGVLVGGIVRKEDYILPTGDEVISKGDRVIVITSKKLTSLSNILK